MLVKIKEVYSLKEIKSWHQFSRDLYVNDEYYISHIDQDIDAIFDSDENSEFEYGDATRWVAIHNDNIVGRIAAFYSKKHQQSGLGFFDCINNQEVANALFDVGIKWLKEKGFNRVEAPVNFGERDKYWGLLVSGFKSPSYQENYNFPYYQKLFENYGFKVCIEQTTSEGRPDQIDLSKCERFSERLLKSGSYRIEHYSHRESERFIKDFVTIYNDAWKHHSHFVPFTIDRVRGLFNEMRLIIREEFLVFMYDKDKPIGFYLSIIELNQLFRYINGNMNWWGKLKFYYYLKTKKVTKIRGIIFGVISEYQNKGLYALMIMDVYKTMVKNPHIESSELAWIGDFNPKMHSLFKSLNAQPSKVHFTYEKLL